MDIKSKLLLSDESSMQACWFRQGGRLRLYQGALSWAQQQGLPLQMERRELKLLPSGLLFAEFSPRALQLWLQEKGLTIEPMSWGWRVALLQPRCLVCEQVWLNEQMRLSIYHRQAEQKDLAHLDNSLAALLDELRGWPAGDLPPMQAVKAIQRWQGRLRKMLPVSS